MIWIALSEKDADKPALEKRLWDAGSKACEPGCLCRLNLAVHGLEGEIKHRGNINSYYDAPRNLVTDNSISNN